MKATIVERLHQEFGEIMDQIGSTEISLRITAEDNFRKSLLLASASYFETRLTESLLDAVSKSANGNVLLEEFVKNKAISRQYHKLFQWDSGNANSFFGLFGPGFKDYMKQKVKRDTQLGESIKAFLEVGAERNRLVHQNYGTFALEKDAGEIYELYGKARIFVEGFQGFMQEYLDSENQESQCEDA